MSFINPKNIIFNTKAMRGSNNLRGERNNRAMREIMSKGNVAKILDKPSEQMELYRKLESKAGGGGVTKNEIREILGEFKMGQGKTIDRNEGMGLADALIGKGPFVKRYIYTHNPKNTPVNKTAGDGKITASGNLSKAGNVTTNAKPLSTQKPIVNINSTAPSLPRNSSIKPPVDAK